MSAAHQPAAPLAEARSHFAFAVWDGKLYVFGGGGEGFKSLSSTEVYDPAADRWERRAPLPGPRSGIVAATVGNRIYVMGGGFRNDDGTFDFKSLVEVYLPEEDRWETGPSLIMRHDAPTAIVHDSAIYLFGGHHPDATGGPLTDPAFGFSEHLENGADRWRELPPMPTPRFSLAACMMHGRIWLMGGGACQDGTFHNLDDIECFDPENGTWSAAETRLPWPGAGVSAATKDGSLYVAGGNDNTRISPRVARYGGDAWEDLPDLPEGRVMGALCDVGGRLILAGGRGPDGKSVTPTTFVLNDGG